MARRLNGCTGKGVTEVGVPVLFSTCFIFSDSEESRVPNFLYWKQEFSKNSMHKLCLDQGPSALVMNALASNYCMSHRASPFSKGYINLILVQSTLSLQRQSPHLHLVAGAEPEVFGVKGSKLSSNSRFSSFVPTVGDDKSKLCYNSLTQCEQIDKKAKNENENANIDRRSGS